MDIQVARYAEEDRSKIPRHYVAYLTKANDVILTGPFFNYKYAVKVAHNIMRGKKSEPKVPLIVAFMVVGLPIYFLYREKYDEALVRTVASGQLTKVVVIENGPDTQEDVRQFAESVLKSDK